MPRLINDDCLKYIKAIPDKSIDLILTDPPYNIAQYSTVVSGILRTFLFD